jgi:hypothetical protein
MLLKQDKVPNFVFLRLLNYLHPEDPTVSNYFSLSDISQRDIEDKFVPLEKGKELILFTGDKDNDIPVSSVFSFARIKSAKPKYDHDGELEWDVTIQIPDQVTAGVVSIGTRKGDISTLSVNSDRIILELWGILKNYT